MLFFSSLHNHQYQLKYAMTQHIKTNGYVTSLKHIWMYIKRVKTVFWKETITNTLYVDKWCPDIIHFPGFSRLWLTCFSFTSLLFYGIRFFCFIFSFFLSLKTLFVFNCHNNILIYLISTTNLWKKLWCTELRQELRKAISLFVLSFKMMCVIVFICKLDLTVCI